MKQDKKIVMIADRIRSMHNVGSFFRNADGAGLSEIALCGYTATPPRIQIAKVSLGAEENIPWKYFPTVLEAIAYYKNEGFEVIALEYIPGQGKLYSDYIPPDKVAFIIGNEIEGIDEETIAACDLCVYLPMYGSKESLNVSVASGIMAYYLSAQQRQLLK